MKKPRLGSEPPSAIRRSPYGLFCLAQNQWGQELMLFSRRNGEPARVLITGGMGFIGSQLAEAYLEQGHCVSVVDDLSTGRFENIRHLIGRPGFRFAVEDVANEVVLDRLASESDLIFHLAAVVGVQLIVDSPMNTIHANVGGTEAVLKAALRYHCKVLITSSSEVYGKNEAVPFSEDSDIVMGPSTTNRWAYAASKVIDEFLGLAYCREKGLPVVVVRLFNTVGPRQSGQYGMVVPRFVEQALSGESLTVYGDGKQSRCFTHVKDVLRALMLLMDAPGTEGQVFNVGSNEEITILDLAHRVVGLVEARDKRLGESPLNDSLPAGALVPIAGSGDGRIRTLSYEEAYHSTSFEDMRRRIPSIDKIRRYTHWTPTLSLDDIINDVLDEYAKRNLVFSDQKAGLVASPKYSAVESRNVMQAVSSQRGQRGTTVGCTIGGTIPEGRPRGGVDHRPGRYDDA